MGGGEGALTADIGRNSTLPESTFGVSTERASDR